MNAVSNVILLGFGNPMLDIIANVDPSLLQKYELPKDGMIYGTSKHDGFFEEIRNAPDVTCVPGGACQNTVRIFVALEGEGTGAYSGLVGDDQIGREMQERCEGEGVKIAYVRDKNSAISTSQCGIGITGVNRSMCAKLSAPGYPAESLKTGKVSKYLDEAKMVYIPGYFCGATDAFREISRRIGESPKSKFIMSFAAAAIVNKYSDVLTEGIAFSDIIISNDSEFRAYAKTNHLDEDASLEDLAVQVARMEKVSVSDPSRIVIVTAGSNPTIIVKHNFSDGTTEIYHQEVPPVPRCDIVDTTAAGDAFLGGFLFGLNKDGDKNLPSAVNYGHRAAEHVIKRRGCTHDFESFPLEKPNVDELKVTRKLRYANGVKSARPASKKSSLRRKSSGRPSASRSKQNEGVEVGTRRESLRSKSGVSQKRLDPVHT